MAGKDDKVEELIKSGEAKIAEGDFEGAIKDHDKAINLNPADKSQLAEVYNDRGFAKHNLGRREEAIVDFDETIRLCDEAIEIDSENARAWYNRGAAKNELGHYEEAIADFDEAIRLDPKNANAWNNRGLAKYRFGDLDSALKDLTEALRLSPNDLKIMNNINATETQKALRDSARKRVDKTTKAEEFKEQTEKYEHREKINRNCAYILMFILAIVIFSLVTGLVVFVLWPEYSSQLGSINLSNPFSLLPFITLVVLITSPLVWAIRLLLVAANKAELMRTEYEHLFIVERRMFVYFPSQDTDKDKEIRGDYIKTTMTNSPADKLLAFQSKTSAPSPNPAQNVIENIGSKVSDKSSI